MSIKSLNIINKRRNIQSESDICNSQNSSKRRHSYEKSSFLRKTTIFSISECAGEARALYQKNNRLNNEIKRLNDINLNIKNFLTKISIHNRESKTINNNKRDESKIYISFKNLKIKNIVMLFKIFNEEIKSNISLIKEEIKINQDKYYNALNILNSNNKDLKKLSEEVKNYNFVLSNKIEAKNNMIDNLNKLIGEYFSKSISEKCLNDNINQSSIDKFISKCLDFSQIYLFIIAQNWNKYRNKVNKLENKKNELLENKNLLNNFIDNLDNFKSIMTNKNNNEIEANKLLAENKVGEARKKKNKVDLINNFNRYKIYYNDRNKTENSMFLFYYFEEFEDELNSDCSEIDNYICNLKNNKTTKSISQRELRNLYYLPQKDLTNSIICSPTMKNILSNEASKKEKYVSIENIPKLDLKQIIYNKNEKYEKYLLIERRVSAYKKKEEENELYELINTNLPNGKKRRNKKYLIDIHQMKKNIKEIKKKIKKNRKTIKKFEEFCENSNEIYFKNDFNYTQINFKTLLKVKFKRTIDFGTGNLLSVK